MNNLSFKVAIGTALPYLPGALHHSLPIPPGYARVMVDDIVEDFADLEIEIAMPEGLTKLGDVKRNIILWNKKYIRFPGSRAKAIDSDESKATPDPISSTSKSPPTRLSPTPKSPLPADDRRNRSTSTRSLPPRDTR